MNTSIPNTVTAATICKSAIMKTKTKLRHVLLLACSSLLAVSSVSAGQTWDGGSLDNSNWNTADNWDSNTLPTFSSAITFSGTNRAANTNDLTADTTIGGINFNNTTAGQAFSISGSRITLGGDITTAASSGAGITDTTSLAMILNNNRTITANTLHSLTLSGSISETGSARNLIKAGTGTLTLSGDNSYSGVTTISAGVLTISHNNALGNTTGNTTIAASGTGPRLMLSGNINSAENFSISGDTESGNYANVISSTSGANTLSGNITLASPGANGIRLGANGGNLIIAGTINQSGTARKLGLSATGGDITVNNAIANGGAALSIITQGGGGSVTLKAVPGTGIGAVTIGEGGKLKLGVNNAIRTDQILTIGFSWGDTGTFDLAGFNQTVSGLVGTKNASLATSRIVTNSAASGTSTLTVGNNNGNGVFDGVINDGATAKVALTKTGTGSQTLAGAGTYSGETIISGGNLVLTNALAMQNSPLNTASSIAGTTTAGLRVTGITTLTLGGLTGNKNFASTGGVFDTDNGGYGSVTALTLNPGTGASHSYDGVIANGAASMTLTKTGAGTQTLSGTNTYTGATIVNAGTLALGTNNVLPNASNVSIGTATLDANTRTDIAGTLDVTGNAVINLGSGAALAFADSKGVDWTGGTLNITGTLGATSLRFGDSADDLTSGQLAKISVNGSGLGNYVLDANGYLVVDVPRAVTLNPADNALNVAETADLVVTFNQTVSKGTGNIEIKDISNNVLETIDVTSSLVTVSGTEATINPAADLPSATECYVLIAPGAFTNATGSFAGITATTTWSFKTAGAPPTLTSIVDNKSGGPIATNTLVTYTVTFSEDMDATTVSSDDFGNAGSATVTLGTVTETAPGVFAVPVTPTSGGTLQLQINAGAGLTNVVGTALVTTSALLDETTLTVDATAPSPNPMTFASSPVVLHTSISMTATTATDPSGVQYFFACTAGGGPDSGWQSSPVFTPTGLNRNTTYSYTVRARDALFNETTPSDPASATTLSGAITLYSSGNKSWNTTSTNWGTVTSGPYNNATWNSGDSAIFEGTAGTVTLGGAITVSNLTFSIAGYTITGGTINFTGGTITVPNPSSGNVATFSSNITGVPALNLTPMDGDEQFTLNPVTGGSMSIGTVSGDGGDGSEKLNLQGGAGSTGTITSVSGPKVVVTAGSWTLSGASSGRDHTISGGTLTLNANLTATKRAVILSGTGVINYNVASAVSASVATTISTDNGFRITGGTLDQTSGSAINANASTTHIDLGGNLTFLGSNGADSNLHLGSGPVWLKDGNRQITVENSATTLTIGGVIQNDDTLGRGLTKAGAGTLELRGINTYSGATTVNAGTLVGVVGGSSSNSAVTVASTGTLGVKVTDTNKQWTCSSVTVSAGTAAKLKFTFTGVPSTTVAPLNITGAVTFTGTPTVVVDAPALPVGTYPLLVKVDGTALVAPPLSASSGKLAWSGDNKTLNLIVPPPGTVISFY